MLTKENNLNIRQFKLLNGEEIIALVNEKTESGEYIIERPFKVNSGMIGGFYFVPWFPFSSQKLFKLTKEKIIYHVELDEDVKQEYIKLAKEGLRPRPKANLKSAEELVDQLANEMGLEEHEDQLFENDIEIPKTVH
tara:strand:- start:320 stop:730 length:411 start_codon:yes stop_codon:yes gene_type:complete